MVPSAALKRADRTPRTLRIGSVSYLNAKPLIHGLDRDERVDLQLAVPAMLLEGLRSGRYDVALLPVIDYQRMEDAVIVPAGGIGCDGATLTVRIFSGVPIEEIKVLACDIESHTSVALARIILSERFGIRPKFIDSPEGGREGADAMLLIGDKVVLREPRGMGHQLDLGEAWKDFAGKPFVFAVWTTRSGVELGELPVLLAQAKARGLEELAGIVADHAVPRGWPGDLAMKYLSEYLKYDIGAGQIEAIRLFHNLAAKHGIITVVRRLDVVRETGPFI
jgi:chorismate dehydratase